MTDTPNALEPCPFCGGEGNAHFNGSRGAFYAYVKCHDCQTQGPVKTGDSSIDVAHEAIAAWNRRTTDATIRAQAEQIARLEAEVAKLSRPQWFYDADGEMERADDSVGEDRQALEADRGV